MAPPQQLELVTSLAETGGDGRAPGQPGVVGATVSLLTGDCLEQMRLLPDASVDCITTDPPYGLSKEPDVAEVLRHWLAGDDYIHRGGGFMGKSWDSFVPGPAVWREAFRVLKPGGHLLAFFGTRTYDLGTMAVRLAGFEIRDMIQWNHGTGFPKSLKVSKVLRESDACCTCDRQDVNGGLAGGDASDGSLHWPLCGACGKPIIPDGLGTALKPAQEPIVVARKPLVGTIASNVLEHGTGALNIDACRIAVEDAAYVRNHSGDRGHAGTRASDQEGATNLHAGGGSASEHGRFPANVILDEFAARTIDETHGTTTRSTGGKGERSGRLGYHGGGNGNVGDSAGGYGDTGGPSRYFYVVKPSTRERNAGLAEQLPRTRSPRKRWQQDISGRFAARVANRHNTVKPITLMQHLIRLVCPPGGTVLDPYLGSGTTGCAAVLEPCVGRFIGIEREPEYARIAQARIAHWAGTSSEAA